MEKLRRGENMNAIKFLKKQHEEAKAGFEKIEEGSEGQRGQLWDDLSPKLKLHEQMEEKHLYGPVSKDAKEPALASWPERHAAEVHEAEQLIEAISRRSPQESAWLQDVTRLHDTLEEHIQEEEDDIWPEIEKVWDQAQLEEAGKKMEAMKTKGGEEKAKR
jgi:Hemerythrin HHE cation binding domain